MEWMALEAKPITIPSLSQGTSYLHDLTLIFFFFYNINNVQSIISDSDSCDSSSLALVPYLP